MEKEIALLENKLFLAMKKGDVETLDNLISDELQFVSLGGVVLNKEDDLSAHRKRTFKISKIEPSEQVIKIFGEVATVTVLVDLVASFSDQPITGKFRFGRTWYKSNNDWKIITGTFTQIQ